MGLSTAVEDMSCCSCLTGKGGGGRQTGKRGGGGCTKCAVSECRADTGSASAVSDVQCVLLKVAGGVGCACGSG